MEDVRIAVVTCNCPAGDIDGNLRGTEERVAEAAARKADIVCFPELSISGYCLDANVYEAAADQFDRVMQRLGGLAGRWNLAIIAGTVEKDSQTGLFFASQLVATPERPVATYRKIHIAPPEKDFFRGGEDVPLFEIPGVAFGVQLCYDAHFPELSTRMALDGADILFFPHASPRGNAAEKLSSWMRHLPARAFDNGVFVVACNQSGDNRSGLAFPGLALVLGPSGEVIAAEKGDGGMLIADLPAVELTAVREHRMRYFLPHRRAPLYRQGETNG